MPAMPEFRTTLGGARARPRPAAARASGRRADHRADAVRRAPQPRGGEVVAVALPRRGIRVRDKQRAAILGHEGEQQPVDDPQQGMVEVAPSASSPDSSARAARRCPGARGTRHRGSRSRHDAFSAAGSTLASRTRRPGRATAPSSTMPARPRDRELRAARSGTACRGAESR